MNSMKNAVTGNMAFGLVLLVSGLLLYFSDLNIGDFSAVIIGIIFAIAFFTSLKSVIQSRKLNNVYKNSWIYKALRLIRMAGIAVNVILNIFEIVPKSDHINGMVFTMLGLTYLLEAGYWKYIISTLKVQ